MTEMTFKLRELWKKERADLRVRRREILEVCSPILSNHAGNVIVAEKRDRDFTKIEYNVDDIIDAYANAVANANSRDEIEYYAALALAYARFYRDKKRSKIIVHYCRGIINEAIKRNERILSYFEKIRYKWRNPYISIPREYVDFPD